MSKLAEFIESMNSRVTPDDTVKALLSQISVSQLAKDPEKIHRAFYRLKVDHQELLRDFDFDTSSSVPFCDLLDRILFRLETSTLLGTLNPNYARYEIPDSTKADFRDGALAKFSTELRCDIEKAGRRLEELIGV